MTFLTQAATQRYFVGRACRPRNTTRDRFGWPAKQIPPAVTAELSTRSTITQKGRGCKRARAHTHTHTHTHTHNFVITSVPPPFVQIVSKLPESWYMEGSTVTRPLLGLGRYLVHLADVLYRSTVGHPDIERQQTRFVGGCGSV